MFVEALRALYGYNRWATERVLEAAAGLSPDQLLAPGTAGHGSIRDTLVHLIAAQRGWLSWWNGSLTAKEAIALRPDPADLSDLAGAELRHVARTRIYVTDMDRQEVAARAHGEAFGQIFPACTFLGVSRLVNREMPVEIDADAVLDD